MVRTILVIDDSQTTLDSLSLVLEDAGYNVVCCREPYRALQLCREIGFDAVICDVYMQAGASDKPSSGLAGIDIIWSLSEEFPRIPIIAMSGYLEEEQLSRIRKANVAAVLSKPFGRTELLAALETALSGK